VAALAGGDRTIAPSELEVAVLSRDNGRRAFRRLDDVELAELLGVAPTPEAEAAAAPPESEEEAAAAEAPDAEPTEGAAQVADAPPKPATKAKGSTKKSSS
jgi:hypothetical protein